MKKLFGILFVFAVVLGMNLTSCNKEESTALTDDTYKSTEVYLTSLEPDVEVRGTGNKEDYEKVVVEEVVKSEDCKGEPVSGIIEFYYDGEMVFSVDFGDGSCDGVATVSYLDDENTLQSKVVDVKQLFKKENEGNHRPKCFEFEFPVSFTMPDESVITINSGEEWYLLREWCEANPGYEEKPALIFPVNIIYEDGTIVTINTDEELLEARQDCKENGNGGPHGERCFEFVLPVSFTMPDGTIITVEVREDFLLIKEWYDANPDVEERPIPVFPVEVTMQDGTLVTVNDQDEMEELREECRNANKCFEFNLPVSFNMPDGSIITVTTEDEFELIKLWYIDNPGIEERPTPVFPVEVTMKDGTILVINNEDEFRELHRDCREHGNGHGGNG